MRMLITTMLTLLNTLYHISIRSFVRSASTITTATCFTVVTTAYSAAITTVAQKIIEPRYFDILTMCSICESERAENNHTSPGTSTKSAEEYLPAYLPISVYTPMKIARINVSPTEIDEKIKLSLKVLGIYLSPPLKATSLPSPIQFGKRFNKATASVAKMISAASHLKKNHFLV